MQDLATSENASEPLPHFSEGYLEAGWRRTLLVRKAVGWGYNVLVTDVDLVWFQHPYLYVDRFPEVRRAPDGVSACVSCVSRCQTAR